MYADRFDGGQVPLFCQGERVDGGFAEITS